MTQNICLYFSDTGGGHRSATEAIEAGIRRVIDTSLENPDISIIKESLVEKSHPLNRFFVELYNYLLRHHQPLMKYYYWFLHAVRPNERGPAYKKTLRHVQNLFEQHQPTVVVSVHPMTNHVLADGLRQAGIASDTKLISVITDPNANLWRAWACPQADYILAPNHIVKDRLVGWGVDEKRIIITGMPVHPCFIEPPTMSRQAFLSHLGLGSDLLTICINAGWAGGGNMLKIYQALASVTRQLQVIFLCGHNTELYEQAMAAAAESDVPTAVLPFHDSLSDLMNSVDLMVTKAGGLTTYEGIARRLPMAFDSITEPMPQEKGTVEMLVSEGMASAIKDPQDIVGIVEHLGPPDKRAVHLPEAYSFNLTDTAVYDISKLILTNCNPTIHLTPKPVSEKSGEEAEQPFRGKTN
jgi:UDP-N-acetylglucosamine:LPS N-acetylglucosamine transferase